MSTVFGNKQTFEPVPQETKKKCSGTCEKCRSKTTMQLSQPVANTETVEVKSLPRVNQDEMRGIEYQTGAVRRHWSGCFRGTPDF